MSLFPMRVEFLLKTDSGYPKDAGILEMTIANPRNSFLHTHWSAPQVSAEVGSYLIAIGYFSVATGPARESRVCPRRPQMEENKPAHLLLLYDYYLVTQHPCFLSFFVEFSASRAQILAFRVVHARFFFKSMSTDEGRCQV